MNAAAVAVLSQHARVCRQCNSALDVPVVSPVVFHDICPEGKSLVMAAARAQAAAK